MATHFLLFGQVLFYHELNQRVVLRSPKEFSASEAIETAIPGMNPVSAFPAQIQRNDRGMGTNTRFGAFLIDPVMSHAAKRFQIFARISEHTVVAFPKILRRLDDLL